MKQTLREYYVSEINRITESARALAFRVKYEKREMTDEEARVLHGFMADVADLNAKVTAIDEQTRDTLIEQFQLDALV